MSERLSLSNPLFIPISLRQFAGVTRAFKDVAETAFGTRCSVEIGLMNGTLVTSSLFHEGDAEMYARQREEKRIGSAPAASEVSRELWQKARYVEVNIRPYNENATSVQSAWAHAEFLGARPSQATLYIQGNGPADFDRTLQDAMSSMRRQFPMMLAGDGYRGNAERQSFMLALQA